MPNVFCNKCGFKMDDESLFCGKCGAPASGSGSDIDQAPQISAGKKRALYALNLSAIIILIIAEIFYYMPAALTSFNIFFTFISMSICLPVPFLSALDVLKGTRGKNMGNGLISAVLNILFITLTAVGIYEILINGRRSDMNDILMFVLSPLALTNFMSFISARRPSS